MGSAIARLWPGYIRHVALIKGSKVNQSGVVVVQGDQVIQEEAKAPARARHKLHAEPLRAEPMVSGEAPPEPIAPGEVAEPAAPTFESADLPAYEEPPSEIVQAIPAAEPAPEAEPDFGDPLAQWDTARDAILTAAHSQAEAAAEEGASEAQSAADLYETLYQEAAQRIAGSLGETPEAEQSLDAIVPAIERQAAARAELEAAQAAARARWRTLASAEEQISALVASFEPPEGAAARLLAEREQILAEARLQAARVLTEAQEEAASIRADAETQGAQALEDFEVTKQDRFEQLREEARAAGYTEGRAQADEEGAKIVEEAIETLNRARLAYPRAVRENQEKLIELAVQVAEKIIGDELAARPDLVLGTLDTALTRVTDLESVTIRVNPEDMPLVQAKEEQYRDMLAQVKKLDFVTSPKIQRGGVFIETSSGMVDATIRTQLSVIAEIFRGVQAELASADDAESNAFEELDG